MHCSNHRSQPAGIPKSYPTGRTGRPLPASQRALALLIALALTTSLILACLQPNPTFAQQGRNPAWTSFTEQLNGSNVRSILAGTDGGVWFGTRRGASYFDGMWQHFTTPNEISAGSVNTVAQTSDGVVWLGAVGGLIKIMRDPLTGEQSFTQQDEPAGPIWVLQAGHADVLWVGYEGGVGYIGEDGWHPVTPPAPALQLERVSAIAIDSRGEVWFGGDSLLVYNRAESRLDAITSFPSTSSITALLVTPATANWPETLWVGTHDDGLWSYNQQEWVHFSRPVDLEPVEGIASNEVLALAEDEEGNLWIGTNGFGISLFNRDGLSPFWGGNYWRNLTTIDGLSANAVGAIAVDRDGIIWVGTINGADRFDSRSWRTLSSPDLPAGLDVVTSLIDSTGMLWIGAEGSGLIRFDGRLLQRFTQEESFLPENFVRTMAEDELGYLWLGTASQGLFRASLEKLNEIRALRPEDWIKVETGLRDGTAWRASLCAKDGSLWFGTYDAGIAHYIPANPPTQQYEEWEIFTVADGLPSNEINQDALLEDGNGTIWAGTPAGAARFDPRLGVWQTFAAEDDLDNAGILSLAEIPPDRPGAGVWAGSETGNLLHFQPNLSRWERRLTSTAPVNALVAAPDLGLWFGGASGLVRYDPATGLRRTYTRSDGLVDNEVSELAVGPSGEVWIGTKLGISQHTPYNGRPRVEILTVNGQKPASGSVSVLAGEPVVITFQGYDLLTPQNDLGFQIRLEGVDESWRVAEETQVTYRNLVPGGFTFAVEAWNAALNLSEQPATVSLIVVPSVVLPMLGRLSTSTAGAIAGLLVIALSGSIGVLFLSLRNRRKRREALKRRFNPYVSGDPIQSSDMFYGRQDVQAKIVNMLHENSIMIHGERRIGKTSLLYQLADQLRRAADPEFLFIPVYVDMEGTAQVEMFHLIMEEILRVAPAYLPALPTLRFHTVPESDYSDRDFSYDMGDLLGALNASSEREIRLILLLDEMDVINEFDPMIQQQLRRIFMRTYARNLGAVVAGIQINKEWDRVESPWYNLFNEIELGPLHAEEARRLILDPIKGIYDYEPAAVDVIMAASQGRPYYIQQHCLEAVNSMLAAGRTRITREDAEKALDALMSARTSQNSGLQSLGDS